MRLPTSASGTLLPLPRRSRRAGPAGKSAGAFFHEAAVAERPSSSLGERRPPSASQISVCSEISRASSTSMPRYRTVDSSLEWPSRSCTARRFFVRR